MKITKLRLNGKKLDGHELTSLMNSLQRSLTKAGFMTDVSILNSSSIRIGQHMRSFSINVDKLGYNAQINNFTISRTKKGFKRTNVPTWGQREQFNHIINDVLDRFQYTGNIKSGEYIVRDETGRVEGWELPEVYHDAFRLHVPSVLEIVPIKFAEIAVANQEINAPWLFVDAA